MNPTHPFGLCQVVHLANVFVEGCLACRCDAEKRQKGKRVSLCEACKEKRP